MKKGWSAASQQLMSWEKKMIIKYQQYHCSFSKDISTQLKSNKIKQPVGIKFKLLYLYRKGEEPPVKLVGLKAHKTQLCRKSKTSHMRL